VTFAAIVVAGYLLGSCPWGYWLVRLFHRQDVRLQGSGATGASNVWRAYGPRLGITVVALDLLKGFLPAFVGLHEVSSVCGVLAGSAAMAGHARPLFLGFRKGGKMVATGAGVVIAIAPWAALVIAPIWIVTFALWRYTSLASLAAAASFPIAAVALGYSAPVIVFAVIALCAIVWLHRSNLKRLRAGTEHRVHLRRAPAHT
jgi:acyl phosphate:glycerol-3-phosphate acyltransferase